MIFGKLTGLHMGDLLQWLQAGELSGRLSFEGKWNRHLDFLDGRVVYAASDCPEERLASWLARSGRFPASEIREVLGHSLLRKRLFTEELLQRKEISRPELRSAAMELAGIITQGILSEQDLSFRFDPEYATRDLLHLDLNLDPNSLLLEAARQLDESSPIEGSQVALDLPFEGEGYEDFFRNLISRGVGEETPMDGASYLEAHDTIRRVMQTLARWLKNSPGLVPMPGGELCDETGGTEVSVSFLRNRPQIVWNLLVLTSLVSTDELTLVGGLEELARVAQDMKILPLLCQTEAWIRPEATRLDRLSAGSAGKWGKAASAAADALGLSPDLMRLGAHALVVPTDLVLWVLTTIAIPHRGLSQALLELLPARVGRALASRASFPPEIQALFAPDTLTPVGICLGLSRQALNSPGVWPSLLPEDPSVLLSYFSQKQLQEAMQAIQAV